MARRFTHAFRRESLNALVRELPTRSLVPLVIAIFAVFTLLGPVNDIFAGGRLPVAAVLRNSALSGLVALGYAFGRVPAQLLVVRGHGRFQVAWIALAARAPSPQAAGVGSRAQLTMDGVLILIAMVITYTAFLIFISGTAQQYFRVRAKIDLAHEIHQVLVPAVSSRVGAFEFLGFSRPSSRRILSPRRL